MNTHSTLHSYRPSYKYCLNYSQMALTASVSLVLYLTEWRNSCNWLMTYHCRCGSCSWSFLWADHQRHGFLQWESNYICSEQSHKQSWVHCWAVLQNNKGTNLKVCGVGVVPEMTFFILLYNKHFCIAPGTGHLCQWQSVWPSRVARWKDPLPWSRK